MQFIERDLKHIWHPCTQMKDFEQCPPLIVTHAKGSYLYTDKGPVIDAISSWWCKSLGHGHPAVIAAIKEQLDSFEHVISAHTTHPLLVEFGEKMAEMSHLQHVFFASDGSCVVEIAMKLALHANQLKGMSHRNEFFSLPNSYHGETLGALSISDLGSFKKPYENYGVQCHFLETLPYVSDPSDPLWGNCEAYWPSTLEQLERVKENLCAIVVEPIVQGANGMRCYSADFLRKLALWAKQNDVYFIADEIMTGLGRTGEWLACQHANITPDLICLSKGLTSGSIPFSCVLIDHAIYALFYDDYDKGKTFLHSHTFSGHALGVSAALATIKAMEDEKTIEHVQKLNPIMQHQLHEIASITGKLTNIRSVGAIVAADLVDYGTQRIGYRVYQEALQLGALLRPLGNTLYWFPPLNIDNQTIEKLAEITLNSIRMAYSKN
ncbi:adenosylmethionine--8-amino-7-oxononanoate transaminase [Legionella maceachernii]|uniref:Adenosylmethionine-8-amino-7-oxononanoate aminotransferase n=2 Tax=Legionella maceachernii TaxID=466 RepID=A0A0W0VYH0_9GAMM|nr:adenosylmethionine--8-amino-7-oxononanoate transaminase [Legionella maceachernii]KTD25098.1 adenosylmethionine-8-amino-7-oxononanoate aminotransferase [Legionella maceachernii]SKA28683.1 adenosylmethionine-8-amino-7-oxononanoate aminotransferase [Legionella maceachernii]SUP02477.1 Adenosylmethionine-8-amino-7-oxononanoate aminotransferase [Legionella maceachernii]